MASINDRIETVLLCLTLLHMSMLFLCGCVENIDVDSDKDLPVVVDCVLQMDTVQTLRLYKAWKLYERKTDPVTDARIELLEAKDNNGKYQKVAVFHNVGGCDWESAFKPEYGSGYKLKVLLDNGKELTATTTFPEDFKLVIQSKPLKDCNGVIGKKGDTTICQMFSAQVAVGKMVNYSEIEDRFEFPVPGEEYFKKPFKFYLPATSLGCKMWIYPHVDTTMVLPPFNAYTDELKLLEIPFTGSSKPYCSLVTTDHPYADDFNLTKGTVSDLDIVKVPVDTKYYFNRLTHSLLNLNYTQWFPILCPDLPLHKRFVRIDHPAGFSNGVSEKDLKYHYLYSPSSFVLLADYQNYFAVMEPFLIEVRFLSDEYDAFLRDLHVKNMSRDNFVLSSYDNDNIFSNVVGGAGVFGAEIVTWAQRFLYGDKYARVGALML